MLPGTARCCIPLQLLPLMMMMMMMMTTLAAPTERVTDTECSGQVNYCFFLNFETTSMEIIQLCQTYLCFELASVMLKKELKNLEISTLNIIILATVL